MFRRISGATSLVLIGMIAFVLYAFEAAQAQGDTTSGPNSGLTEPPPPAPEMLENTAYPEPDYGFYDQGVSPPEPRKKSKVPLAGVTEIRFDHSKPEPRYVPAPPKHIEEASRDPDALVEVEGSDYVSLPGKNKYKFAEYKLRRKSFGTNISLGLSQYRPNLVLNNRRIADGAVTDYEMPETNLVEFQVSPRWNFLLGSLSLDLSAGQYFDRAHGSDYDSALTATVYRVGATYSFDNAFGEPYLVPYVSGGFYQVSYQEQGGDDLIGYIDEKGSTPIAPYFAAGLNIQLNWLDWETAKKGYQDVGLENGFLYVEARQFASAGSGPDFSSRGIDVQGGVRVEF